MGKSSLRTILDSTPRKRAGTVCRTCRFVETLSADDKAAFDEYLVSDIPTSVIRDALENYGFKISVSALANHRRTCTPLN